MKILSYQTTFCDKTLEDASDELKDDIDVVFAAVAQYGYALHYASERLKDDKDVVLAALAQNNGAIYYASSRLKDDKDVMCAAKAPNNDDIPVALNNDIEVVRTRHSPAVTIGLVGFFSGAAAMGATLYFSPMAQALVISSMLFLPQAAAIGIALLACGIVIMLLALMVHAVMRNCAEDVPQRDMTYQYTGSTCL